MKRVCSDELNKYISRVYISEIKQKNTELKQKKAELMVLQAQVNPHFLYNRLETIRMKAVVNGDTNVGQMIFGWKSQGTAPEQQLEA